MIICINCNFTGHKIAECPEPIRPELVRNCTNCNQEGHEAKNCPSLTTQTDPTPAATVFPCHYCKKTGHYIKDCPERMTRESQAIQAIVCNYCKQPGHHIKDCLVKQAQQVIICSYCKTSGHHIKDCSERIARESQVNKTIPAHLQVNFFLIMHHFKMTILYSSKLLCRSSFATIVDSLGITLRTVLSEIR